MYAYHLQVTLAEKAPPIRGPKTLPMPKTAPSMEMLFALFLGSEM